MIMKWPKVQILLGLVPHRPLKKASSSERSFNDESQRKESEQEREEIGEDGSEESNDEEKNESTTASSNENRNSGNSSESQDQFKIDPRERVQSR